MDVIGMEGKYDVEDCVKVLPQLETLNYESMYHKCNPCQLGIDERADTPANDGRHHLCSNGSELHRWKACTVHGGECPSQPASPGRRRAPPGRVGMHVRPLTDHIRLFRPSFSKHIHQTAQFNGIVVSNVYGVTSLDKSKTEVLEAAKLGGEDSGQREGQANTGGRCIAKELTRSSKAQPQSIRPSFSSSIRKRNVSCWATLPGATRQRAID